MTNEVEQMQHNLAKLLTEHFLVVSEPTNPFEKKLFDRHMRKSMISASVSENVSPNVVERIKQYGSCARETDSDEVKVAIERVDSMMHHLQSEAERLKTKVKSKIAQIFQVYRQKHTLRKQLVDQLLDTLEGSIQFILTNCFDVEHSLLPENKLNNHPERGGVCQEQLSEQDKLCCLQNSPTDQTVGYTLSRVSDSQPGSRCGRNSRKKTQKGHSSNQCEVKEVSMTQSRERESHEGKSIYEVVLQEREKRIRKTKRRIV